MGDGIADDTVAIQNTIDAAIAAGSRPVYAPAGSYLTTSTLSFANMSGTWKGLTFFGDGTGMRGHPNSTQILNASGHTALLAYSTSTSSYINGLQLRDFQVTNSIALPATEFTIDCSAVVTGLGVQNVQLYGSNLVGNGFRHSITNGQWTLDRLQAYNFPVAGAVGIEITDGWNPNNMWVTYLRPDHWISQGGNGFLSSCMTYACDTGFYFSGDNIGVGGMGNKALYGAYGFRLTNATSCSLLACHSEGETLGYYLNGYCRGNTIKGLHSGSNGSMGANCAGDGNTIDIVEIATSGTIPVSIELGAGSTDNNVHSLVRSGTVTALYHDLGTSNHLGW